jgi:leader peptidase (prepilin peptidase) / N-methyltransferase
MSLDEALSLLPKWFAPVATFTFGLLWGSFLNVVIYRVPREMSVVRPGSHCPGCSKPIAGYDNIPVFSYVILRGKARCCGVRMSPRYPLVELMGGLLSLAIWMVIIGKLPGDIAAGKALAIYGAHFFLVLGLVAAAFIDAEHMFLPDSIMYGGIVLGLATAYTRGMAGSEPVWTAFARSGTGVLVGFLVVWVPFIFLYKGLLGRTGMGWGDAKLLALAGAWFGWPGALVVLLAGALQGTVYAGILKVLGVKPKLPKAVQDDIDELKKAAAEGDEEAKKLLEDDPLTENEDDPFIITFFQRIFGGGKDEEEEKVEDEKKEGAPEEEGSAEEEDAEAEEEDEPLRPRIPFGPFLILAMLELLFAGDVLHRFLPFVWPSSPD